MNKLNICRQASILCGEQPIMSLNEESITAKYCFERYDNIVRNLQNETFWTFCLERKQLQRTQNDDLEYEYAFKLPNGFLRLKQFLENREKEIYIPRDFDFVGDKILCDKEKIAIEYTKLLDDTDLPYYLEEVVQYALASDIAYALTEKTQLSQQFEMKYRMALKQAKLIDGQHERPVKMWQSNYLKAKLQGGYNNGRN